MDSAGIAAELSKPAYSQALANVTADFAGGAPADRDTQRARVDRLVALAALLNSATATVTADDGTQSAVPFWQVVAGRELDFGDVITALGHRWEELSVPDPEAAS